MTSRVAIIPAKGLSRRIPGKNLRPFFGKPIIAYSLEVAKASGLFDRICVSTDDQEVAAVARSFGGEVLMRPATMAEVGTQEVAAFALEQLCTAERIPHMACVIYATSPLLLPSDLQDGYAAMQACHPCFAMSVGTEPLRDAGAYYWGHGSAFLRRVPLIDMFTVMVPLDESRVCDINCESDWRRAEQMYGAREAAHA